MEKYKLTDLIPHCDWDCIIYVFGKNYHFVSYGDNSNMTFKDVIEKAIMDRKEKHGSCFIIVERPLNGVVYQFGNGDRKYVYEHGKVCGYA